MHIIKINSCIPGEDIHKPAGMINLIPGGTIQEFYQKRRKITLSAWGKRVSEARNLFHMFARDKKSLQLLFYWRKEAVLKLRVKPVRLSEIISRRIHHPASSLSFMLVCHDML